MMIVLYAKGNGPAELGERIGGEWSKINGCCDITPAVVKRQRYPVRRAVLPLSPL
jgi:hypothetical protein